MQELSIPKLRSERCAENETVDQSSLQFQWEAKAHSATCSQPPPSAGFTLGNKRAEPRMIGKCRGLEAKD